MPIIGTGHVWIIGIVLIIVLIIWGPGKLPDVGSGMGRAIREFRKASTETKDHLSGATVDSAPAPAPAPAAAVPANSAQPTAVTTPVQHGAGVG